MTIVNRYYAQVRACGGWQTCCKTSGDVHAFSTPADAARKLRENWPRAYARDAASETAESCRVWDTAAGVYLCAWWFA